MPLAPFLQVSSLVDLHSGGDALPLADDGLFVPDWVLDVQGVQQAQVRGAGQGVQGEGCKGRGEGLRGRGAGDERAVPDWVLDVQGVQQAQVRGETGAEGGRQRGEEGRQ